MARKFQNLTASGKNILLVDDDKVYIQVMKRILENEGHSITTAENGNQALEILESSCFDLLLIDYYMPGMTGEELIKKIRETNKIVQIILQTGYANEQPPRELIKRMDIQGFFNKSEGPESFLLWVDVGLKAATSIQQIIMNRKSLKTILDGSGDLFRIQSMNSLLLAILDQLINLVYVDNSCIYAEEAGSQKENEKNCLIATMEADGDLTIRVHKGHQFQNEDITKLYSSDIFPVIRVALDNNRILEFGSSSIIPLCSGNLHLGIIIIEEDVKALSNTEMIEMFANQAAIALHNLHLYQQATFDPLTRIFMRGVFIITMIREMRLSLRYHTPLALLLIDIDKMKNINDTLGHLAGDQGLKYIGEALSFASRETDIRGRIGGDEFALLLLNPHKDDITLVTDRIYEYLADKKVEKGTKSMAVNCSIGVCFLNPDTDPQIDFHSHDKNHYFKYMYKKMVQSADEALYKIKRNGGNAVNKEICSVKWQDYESLHQEFKDVDLNTE